MEYIIEALKVEKTFSGHKALNGISLQVPKGIIFGLLGPNGAGKTTFIRCLNGILLPENGQITINKQAVSHDTSSTIGYLPEERGLYKKMKVGDHLIYLARLKGLTKKDAHTQSAYWLKKFNIGEWVNKSIEELSKGMAQKIQFITTVIHQPDLLILDEPFSGFDPVNAEIIKKEIIAQQEKGVSIILSTHNMSSVEELCSHIALLDKGNLVLEGNIDQVKARYAKKEFEIIFTGNMISLASALWTGFELLTHEKLQDKRLKVTVTATGKAGVNELIRAILPSCKIWSVIEKVPSMHEIFLDQVQSASPSIEQEIRTTEKSGQQDKSSHNIANDLTGLNQS